MDAGSVGIAGWIATLAFPVLLIWGFANDEIGRKSLVMLLLLGAAIRFGLPIVTPSGGYLVTSAFAVLDIVLVLTILKRDVRIT